MDWEKLLDDTAEQLERRGDTKLAGFCDALAEHIDESTIASVLDDVAEELERRGDTALASLIDQGTEAIRTRAVMADARSLRCVRDASASPRRTDSGRDDNPGQHLARARFADRE